VLHLQVVSLLIREVNGTIAGVYDSLTKSSLIKNDEVLSHAADTLAAACPSDRVGTENISLVLQGAANGAHTVRLVVAHLITQLCKKDALLAEKDAAIGERDLTITVLEARLSSVEAQQKEAYCRYDSLLKETQGRYDAIMMELMTRAPSSESSNTTVLSIDNRRVDMSLYAVMRREVERMIAGEIPRPPKFVPRKSGDSYDFLRKHYGAYLDANALFSDDLRGSKIDDENLIHALEARCRYRKRKKELTECSMDQVLPRRSKRVEMQLRSISSVELQRDLLAKRELGLARFRKQQPTSQPATERADGARRALSPRGGVPAHELVGAN